MDIVMNNYDLRREIWSYLRKEARIRCSLCYNVCIWDKKKRCKYLYSSKYINSKKTYVCQKCWGEPLTQLLKQ